ncbi:MAG: response regulator transcription factor [Bacteroidia bacterium]|nr:response regulator transcription factor [Bacteroidota bacterium]MBK7388574.1 response regulator transcription factor [Bacteroidota bacterium]MBK8873018.1 response regulator transcription factor [Bacteroidota bacterium]MBP9083665.1 response regulator transcription factor [Bacteroidia bacterium]
MIKVALVDDNVDLREGLQIVLKEHSDEFECIGAFGDAETALNKIPELKPDVVLMDINLPGISGIECLKQLKPKLPNLDVIMLTVFADDDTVFDSLCAGACGYITKNASPEKILDAIREVRDGGAPMSGRIARMVVTSFKAPGDAAAQLTDREKEVLDQLCKGKSYKMVADALNITHDTVRHHIKNIYKKLEVHSVSEAILKTMKKKLI